ncbi:glycosyltransferase involved in cell wall biosynthesis [Inhella inkyongensis]|uniref:Glycosyltransferase involved in cell wall biosynthesis n=1 Tax=Inhella inkyongensis TaxID=392593 RepID=A0A840S645_9BURK|nr:glycosyltransferase family 4 protein [Inhella inkyongensis]MBB5204476.1 glycosyltransferase involved in cell wall biosynthesis [Inhella inkyongensis]
MKVAIVANSAWYLQNFRLGLARHLLGLGHEVLFVSPADGHESKLTAQGFAFQAWPLASASTNPWREMHAVRSLRRLLDAQAVEAVLSYTPKGNIYSGLALTGRRAVFLPNISGLGRAFIEPGLLTHVVTLLYRQALQRAQRVIFQNEDDRDAFVQFGIVTHDRSLRVPGSGVDLARFQPQAWPTGPRRFLFVGRLLRDKGVNEFVAAARAIRSQRKDCEFVMLGSSRSGNPTAVPISELQTWLQAGWVQHIEQLDDVRPELARAHCVVLPSYREGVPRSLLEAAAMARPVLATDVPGCRDTVRPGRTGLLCEARSASALEAGLSDLLAMSDAQLQALGQAGRAFMEEEFDERKVLATYAGLLSSR